MDSPAREVQLKGNVMNTRIAPRWENQILKIKQLTNYKLAITRLNEFSAQYEDSCPGKMNKSLASEASGRSTVHLKNKTKFSRFHCPA